MKSKTNWTTVERKMQYYTNFLSKSSDLVADLEQFYRTQPDPAWLRSSGFFL
jgi:hypothetical protein